MADKSIYHKNDMAWNAKKRNHRGGLKSCGDFFVGLFNKAIIPLAVVGHKMTKANLTLRTS